MHIYLIGYRGSGKTTVGKKLSQRLSLPAVDADDLIEQAAGRSIRDIFAAEGEAGFRDREQAVVEELAGANRAHPQVVSLGGGAILREANRAAICQSGWRVWLTASPEILVSRIRGDSATAARRPALSSLSDYDEVVAILAARQPLYESVAQKIVNTDSLSADAICEEIADWLSAEDLGL